MEGFRWERVWEGVEGRLRCCSLETLLARGGHRSWIEWC